MNTITIHLDGDTVTLSSPRALVQGDFWVHQFQGDELFFAQLMELAPEGFVPRTPVITFNNGTYKVRVPMEYEIQMLPEELLFVSGKLSASITVEYEPGDPPKEANYEYPTRTFTAAKGNSIPIRANAGWELEVWAYQPYTPDDNLYT